MSIKLIAIDMDKTLLDDKQMISEENVKTIKMALQQGIKIVLCSGRPLAGLARYLKQLGIHDDDQYVVTYNRAIIQSVSGRIINRHLLTNEDYLKLKDFAIQNHVQFNFLDDKSNIYTPLRKIGWNIVRQAAENKAGLTVISDSAIKVPITKFMLADYQEKLDRVESSFFHQFPDYYVVRSQPYYLEASALKANKGNGLAELRKYLGIPREETMALGDAPNDLPMFKASGLAVAMGNASDTVKKQADQVTDTNLNNGVAKAIKKVI